MSEAAAVTSRVLLVDKPVGWTSFDVVRRVRRGGRQKVGHAGTLDPFATGLLAVLVGQATRVSSLLMELPKEYICLVQFGAVSSTGDPTGEIESTQGRTRGLEVLAALDLFRGAIVQRVPMTSAVKVGGERLYHKAHRGETVDTPEREVFVHELELTAFDEATQTGTLLTRTSKGTYVRRLAEDLGAHLGVGAYAAALRRTRIGHLSVDDAVTPDDAASYVDSSGDAWCLPLASALDFLPRYSVEAAEAARAANGGALEGGPGGRFLVTSPAGVLGVWEGTQASSRPLVVFPNAEA